jgi:polysaccharide biosynthesis protein PslH
VSTIPRILYLTPYWPHRATCASELRVTSIARALKTIGEVELAVVETEGGASEWAAMSQTEFKVITSFPLTPLKKLSNREGLKWWLDPRVSYPHGCGVGYQDSQRLFDLAKNFDMIWFGKLRTANMFPRWKWPKSVADIDDVPSTYERSALSKENTPKGLLRAAMRFLCWRRRDKLLGERFDVLGVCSKDDEHYLRKLGVKSPMHVIPNGFSRPSEIPISSPDYPPRLGFIGIFDYAPNVEGVRWFTTHCWPKIKHEVPNARLRLIGRFGDGPRKPAGDDIDGLGWLSDAAVDAEIATWSNMIVPIHFGAGTRGKIALAFSRKCPLVSTHLGAHGYNAKDGRDMFLADSADDFVRACIRTIRQPVEAAAMADRAWNQFLLHWTWEAIRPRACAAAEECLRLNPAEF